MNNFLKTVKCGLHVVIHVTFYATKGHGIGPTALFMFLMNFVKWFGSQWDQVSKGTSHSGPEENDFWRIWTAMAELTANTGDAPHIGKTRTRVLTA